MTTPIATELFQGLDRGAAAITANRRLARQVEQRYAEWKIRGGSSAWPTPRIKAYEDWLLELWRSLLQHRPGEPQLLSDDQERLLWERIIRRHPAGGGAGHLLQLSGTARAARLSWARVHEWGLDCDELRRTGGSDSRAFMRWADALRESLAGNGWLTAAELPDRLAGQSGDWPGPAGADTWWLGFDLLSPARARMRERLAERGGSQRELSSSAAAEPAAEVVPCDTFADQWRRIARWARGRLAGDPGMALGVICPDLRSRREEIEEILEDVLHPELPWRPDAPRAFHLSLGRPLPEYPIVAAALDLLRWTAGRAPFAVVSRILRSPCLKGGDSELENRAAFEVQVREWQQETIGVDYLARRAAQRDDLPVLSAILARAGSIAVPARAPPAAWAETFSQLLGVFGWPGDRALDSHEFQVQRAWREQLSRFAALGAVQPEFTRSEALKQLTAAANARVLQFHDDRAPLQIVGIPEADGLWFDEVWLADMSDAVWPPPPRPDPFIPVSLQKRHGMPGASARAALEQAQRKTRGFLAGAPRVRVSFAAGEGDTRAALSPLFAGLPTAGDADDRGYPGRRAELSSSALPLESVPDHRAPVLPDNVLRGGVSLIADQARCPFRALAHFRLGVRALREVGPGLSAAERGTLVHAVLGDLWDAIGDSDTLGTMSREALRESVTRSVDRGLSKHFADSRFRERFLDIERRRLADLVLEWLSLEARRPPFRVAATEVEMRVRVGDGEFPVRVDRIDELEDGRLLIMDYKTGRLVAVREWADPRTEEPQLPMYALGVERRVAALALGGIRRGECELRGIGDGVEGVPLKPVEELGFDGIDAIRGWWHEALGSLASAYRAGDARLDPKSPRTCLDCDATALCRIFEQRRAPADE